MKTINYFITSLLIAVVILFVACKEEISEPCGNDIDIMVKTVWKGCDSGCENIASKSDIVVTVPDGEENAQRIRIAEDETDENGELIITIPNSGCGINDLRFEGSWNNSLDEVITDYLCKDTIIILCFDKCQPFDLLSCDNLENIETELLFGNQKELGNSLEINSPAGNNYYSKVASVICNDESNPITVSGLNPNPANLTFVNDKIRITATYLNGQVIKESKVELDNGDKLDIKFEILTNEIGCYDGQIDLPLACASNGIAAKWTIKWDFCVDEVVCECPFELLEIFDNSGLYPPGSIKKIPVLQGNEDNADVSFQFFKWSDLISEDCTIEITDLSRIGVKSGTEPFAEYPDINPGYNWKVSEIPNDVNYNDWTLNNIQIGSVYSSKDYFKLDASFGLKNDTRNNLPSISKDTFKIDCKITNPTNTNIVTDCHFYLILEGHRCFDMCPAAAVEKYNDMELFIREVPLNTSGEEIFQDFGKYQKINELDDRELIDLTNDPAEQIFCDFSYYFSENSACNWSSYTETNFGFDISYSYLLNNDLIMCNESEPKSFKIGLLSSSANQDEVSLDQEYFKFYIDGKEILPQNNFAIDKFGGHKRLTISFTAPTFSEHENNKAIKQLPGGHGNEYWIRFVISDESGTCSKIVNIKAKLLSFEISPVRHMYAYSQVTPLASNPDYEALIINERHDDNFWTVVNNQTESNTAHPGPDLKYSNGNAHTFYVEVQNPTTPTIGGDLKLFLVKDNANIFDRITKTPIARYNSYDEFKSEIGKLITSYLTTLLPLPRDIQIADYTSQANTQDWNSGVALSENDNGSVGGEVYLIWSSTSGEYEYSPGRIMPCEAALIYIDYINDRSVSIDQTGKSKLGCRVVYPIR